MVMSHAHMHTVTHTVARTTHPAPVDNVGKALVMPVLHDGSRTVVLQKKVCDGVCV